MNVKSYGTSTLIKTQICCHISTCVPKIHRGGLTKTILIFNTQIQKLAICTIFDSDLLVRLFTSSTRIKDFDTAKIRLTFASGEDAASAPRHKS